MADDVIETTEAPEADDTEILADEEEALPTEEDEDGELPEDETPEPKPKKDSPPPRPKPAAKGKDEEKPKDEPPPKPKKIVRGKVNGEETDIELEPEEVEAVRAKQMRIAGQRALQEAAEKRKEAEKILSTLKADPWAALKQAGIDVDAAVEKYAMEYVQKQTMTPEQREAHELRQKLKAIEDEKASKAKEEEDALYAAERKKLTQQLDKEFAEGAKAAGLPANPKTIARMAWVVQSALEQGYEMEPEEAAQRVKEEIEGEHKALFGGLDGDELLSALGPEVVERVRKTLVQKAKAKRTVGTVEPIQGQPREPRTQRFTSMAAYMRSVAGRR